MAQKQIIVTFDGGETTVETKGFNGAECLKATEELEAALGNKTSSKATREMHTRATAKATQGAGR